jgi:hypothetical protein
VVDGRGWIDGQSAERLRLLEHGVDGIKDTDGRSERIIKLFGCKSHFALFVQRTKMTAHLGEFVRNCALKREDRLLLIADCEQSPAYVFARRRRNSRRNLDVSIAYRRVSCASSTSTWSMPRSNLYRTSRCRALGRGIVSSVSVLSIKSPVEQPAPFLS